MESKALALDVGFQTEGGLQNTLKFMVRYLSPTLHHYSFSIKSPNITFVANFVALQQTITGIKNEMLSFSLLPSKQEVLSYSPYGTNK
ncbi:hypothetical protein PN36_35125 [Candidatus Thiomargarita nelsonii]|uniref:Uncharacterized protein n=1 Tax=Candidatus Thiomargarita nelsonii TaxID=1003181 RepID=A0A4E0QUS8_9GAMM|nr:hypothetical protein PN36_35125 [Candidatus Thiomargarita nelsonii]